MGHPLSVLHPTRKSASGQYSTFRPQHRPYSLGCRHVAIRPRTLSIPFGKTSRPTARASNLAGALVRNPADENIGKLEDVVIELADGDVAYAVLHFQDWFHDKLFAVPWAEMTVAHDEALRRYFVLDTTRERLKSAPGFNPDRWPDIASDEWRDEVNSHYDTNKTKQRTKVTTKN